VLLLVFLSFTNAITVTDVTTNDLSNQQAQSFAQINAKITDLANALNNLSEQDKNFQQNAFLKSDLQNLYENMVNINHQAEMSIIIDNVIIVILAFCIFFILIGKNLIPQHIKQEQKPIIETPKKPQIKKTIKKPLFQRILTKVFNKKPKEPIHQYQIKD
jgi:hypothetical protein